MNAPTVASVASAACAIVAFVTALFALTCVLSGRRQAGILQPDGRRHVYTLNGLTLFLVSLVAVPIIEWLGGSLGVLIRNYWSLFIAANIMAFAASALLMWAGRCSARPGLRTYYYGAQRDPILAGVDLKLFSYRPSLIGLALLNIGCGLYQWETTGNTSLAMALYLIMTLIYVGNYFQFEYGMMFTWDIVEERFGWMLVWGDYVLVPFFYCIPGLALALRPVELSPVAALGVSTLFAVGFWLFRGANQQKHDFKSDPNIRIWGKPAKLLQGRLLVSGFWGIGRKLNYTGELCIYIAWTIPAGMAVGWAWLLPAWLAGLLVHRAWRDDCRCRAKYGPVWDEYCRLVPFRMFPLIY
jgi:delta14-sterol reductase